MKNRLYQLIGKYFDRLPKAINTEKPIVDLPHPVLFKSAILGEKFTAQLIKEVREKCGELGYEIDHVVFFSAFDSPVIFNQKHIRGDSDDYLAIFRRKDESSFAVVFVGAWLEAK
jgi:hypothetical protein|tara:strand:- start:608 stop:952 length:345 start_codon:yes stop_codon:yes gene_type:complete